MATWARRIYDEPLETAFRDSWIDLGYESRTFKSMRPDLPQSRLPNSNERYEWKDFFRSDHASFWFPPMTSMTVRRSSNRTHLFGHSSLNAILLTDLGPWRKSYSKCYHSVCDDEHLLTDDNLAFMQQVTDALVLTLLRVGQGECGVGGSGSTTPTQSSLISSASSLSSSSSLDLSASPSNANMFTDFKQKIDRLVAQSSAMSYVTIDSPNSEQSPSSLSSSLPTSSINTNASVASSMTPVSTTTTTTSTTTTTTTDPSNVYQMSVTAQSTTQSSSSLSSNIKPPGGGGCVSGKSCTNATSDATDQAAPKIVINEEPCQDHTAAGANCISTAHAH